MAPATTPRHRNRILLVGVAVAALVVLLVVGISRDDDDERAGLRTGAAEADSASSSAAGDETAEAGVVTPPTTAVAVAASSEPVPSTAPAAPTTAAPTTGTLRIEVAPVSDGGSRRVWVSGPTGASVLPATEVTGPIVIEGLAPGAYEVFVETTGVPSGPDENGVELGGGSEVTRRSVDIVAGEATTVI